VKNAEKPKIIVAGAGIGGLAAALSLIKRGFEVEIYEQAQMLQEIGAGVQLSANGMLVLHELGLAIQIMEEAAHPERREIRMWNTGQAWTAFDLGAVSVQTFGHPYVTMFRPDLLGILSDAVTTAAPRALRLGHRAIGCETVGERAILQFDDGSTAEGDALIGADGIHSMIRAGLHGSETPNSRVSSHGAASSRWRICRPAWHARSRRTGSAPAVTSYSIPYGAEC
jgi:2-polyprenyl-6-methoxyphenol hydroxylase-like FAD-dependent oxidoreductase